MIGRIWHGWTTPANGVPGYRGIRLLRRPREEEVEELTPTHVRGTFTFTFTNDGGGGSTDLYAFGGRFDVPFDGRAGGMVCGLPPSVGCLHLN
jgi:hypothetical protein